MQLAGCSLANAGPVLADATAPMLGQQLGRHSEQPVLERYWLMLGGLWFRALCLPCSIAPLVLAVGMTGAAGPALLACAASAVYAAVAIRLVPDPMGDRPAVKALLALDTTVAVTVNLWAARVVTVPPTETGFGLFWPLMQGSVILWLAAAGTRAAIVVLVAGSAVAAVMVATAAVPAPGSNPTVVVSYVGWLVLALTVAYIVRSILRTRARISKTEGWQAGELAERARNLRQIHDTALQSLEGIALLSSAGGLDPDERLQTIGRVARAEATLMRQLLDDSGGRDLTAELTSLVEFSRSLDQPAELRTSGEIPQRLPRRVRDACVGAVLEAMTNARQHARAGCVVVTVHGSRRWLHVEVVDDGDGFDQDRVDPGFGLRQSIAARVSEAGGVTNVRSSLGAGTSVVLGFPVDDSEAVDSSEGEPPEGETRLPGQGAARERAAL